jgi:hypothetical protein
MKQAWLYFGWLFALLCCGGIACAQEVTLTARVSLAGAESKSSPNAGNVLLWLTPIEPQTSPRTGDSPPPRLVQKNKTFEPHVLVVPVGSVVQFPNRDPFFHNVFSLFEGKRFDLGLYEAGTTRDVRFDRAGISYIFCNIHPEMSAVIIALDTPYYGLSNARGEVVLPNVPVGRYRLQIWYEGALPDALKAMNREITVSENDSTLGVLRLATSPLVQSHKNKYGRDYDPPSPDNPAYQHP